MANFQQTRKSGSRFEEQIVSVIEKYTPHIWRNIRIETLLTANGTTEIDIMFCHNDILFIIEAKNVSSIIGEYNSKTWSFVGSENPLKETQEYCALNVLVQNNIHVRSFKDCFFAYFNYWPCVVPVIVIPNNCWVSEELRGIVYTIQQLDDYLSKSKLDVNTGTLHRRVNYMVHGDGDIVLRPDFEMNNAIGKRCKIENRREWLNSAYLPPLR